MEAAGRGKSDVVAELLGELEHKWTRRIREGNIMSASTELQLREVMNAFEELPLDELRRLLIEFGVEMHVLRDIGSQSSGMYDCKAHYISAWLQRDLEASWEKIVDGLKKIKMDKMAAKIASQYLEVTDSPSCATNHPFTHQHPPTTRVAQPESQYHLLMSADSPQKLGVNPVVDSLINAITLGKFDVVEKHMEAGFNLNLQNKV
jgi:hypothetical protein